MRLIVLRPMEPPPLGMRQRTWRRSPSGPPTAAEQMRAVEDSRRHRCPRAPVAQAAPRADIFEALVTEVGRLIPASDAALVRFDGDTTLTMIGRWNESDGYLDIGARHPFGSGTLAWLVSHSGRPSRIDSYAETPGSLPEMIRGWGWRSSVGAPVIVDAEVWGLTAVGSTTDRPLPPDTEQRLAEFTELLANAIANAQSREELEQLAAEQAALRRVAELAAHDAPPGDVLEEVVAQASNLVGVAFTTLVRFESDGATEVVAIHDPPEGVTVGMRAPGEGDGATQRVWRTGRTARVDRLSDVSGAWPVLAARQGYSSSAAAPILAEDRLWGALVAAGRGSLPPHIEEQLSRFAELAGTAIAGSQARAALQTLADEQAALRRVAELVARDAAPQAVLDAVVDEASRQFGDAPTALMRHGSDGFATVVAACRGPQLLGVRIPLDGRSSTGDISRSGRPARTDDYATSDAQLVAREHGVAATGVGPRRRGGRRLGQSDGRIARRPAARRPRGPDRAVRRSRGDGRVQRARPGAAAATRRRAGGATAGRRARGPRRRPGRAVRVGGDRGVAADRRAWRDPHAPRGPRAVDRHGDARRPGPRRHAAHRRRPRAARTGVPDGAPGAPRRPRRRDRPSPSRSS